MNDKGLIICPISNIIGQLSSKLTPRPHIQIFVPSLWIKICLHDLLCHQAAIQSNSAVVCASLQTKTTTVMCEFGRWLEQNIVCTRPNSPQKKTKRTEAALWWIFNTLWHKTDSNHTTTSSFFFPVTWTVAVRSSCKHPFPFRPSNLAPGPPEPTCSPGSWSSRTLVTSSGLST